MPYSSEFWPIHNILPRTDNSTVKNQAEEGEGYLFLFIPHGLDEIDLSEIFP